MVRFVAALTAVGVVSMGMNRKIGKGGCGGRDIPGSWRRNETCR